MDPADRVAQIHAFLSREAEFVLLAAVLLAAGAIAASIHHRRSSGKPIRTAAPAGSIFVETWTSGRSLMDLGSRLGGGYNCLLVAVTGDAIVVHPHFPFTLGFVPELCGLDWEIPRASIKRVTARKGLVRDKVVVEFSLSQTRSGSVELRLRDPTGFQQALAATA